MASRYVNRGLLRTGQQAFESTNYNAARNIQVLSVDDSSNAFGQTDPALNTGGAVTNMYDQAFDGTPTESGQTVTCVTTIATGNGNFTIRRVAMHDDTTTNVTTSSTTLCAGIDGQSVTKTSDFSLAITLQTTYTSV